MLYPLLKLHRFGEFDDDEASAWYVTPLDVRNLTPMKDGGTFVNLPQGGSVSVRESPKMISEGINSAIKGAAVLGQMGAIEAGVNASAAMAAKPVIARPFNGG